MTRPIFSAHAAAAAVPVTTKCAGARWPITHKEELAYTKYANGWLLAQTLQWSLMRPEPVHLERACRVLIVQVLLVVIVK